ncbi:MAG: cytochrome b N-terminal domain-containing protein [Acidimicrobiia bacterium]|nr:cytochrome b N-terminal domain-containing protein [Acidimicrobiia bacterium]
MEPRRTAIQRTHRVLLLVLAVLFLVLLITGLWLAFRYQPSGTFGGAHHESWLRVAHRVTSSVFLVVALATFGLSIAVSFERLLTRGTPTWVLGLSLVIGALAAGLSGYLLPWDQLALAPIRPGQYRGFAFLFAHKEVHFVLIGTTEVAKATVRAWFFAHIVAVPIVLVALGVFGWRATRRARLAPFTDEDGSA